MRLRIQSFPPLPELKAWFIPDVPTPLLTVADLKEAVCLRIPILKDAGISGSDVDLLLDEFELLNDSPFSVVRDGDLVYIKPSAGVQIPRVSLEAVMAVSSHTRKRKRSPAVLKKPAQFAVKPTVPLLAKHRVTAKFTKPSESSDESSSSESSSSSSSCSSSSSPFSCSSSSSSSSSSTSSPPTPQPSKPTKKSRPSAPIVVPIKPTTTTPSVPPGLGKPTTHTRNLRRRLKKKLEKEEESQPTAPKGSSSTNLVPLGQKPRKTVRERHGPAVDVASALNNAFGSNDDAGELLPGTLMDVDEDDEDAASTSIPGPSQLEFSNHSHTQGQVLMASLGNKNKRRGYKQSLSAPVPKKIVFSDDASQPQDATPLQESTNGCDLARPRLVPPSELQERGELPPNMFVTSVDVEEGMWDKKKKKKSKRKDAERYQEGNWAGDSWYDDSQAAIDPYASFTEEMNGVDTLSYGESEAGGSTSVGKFDWDRAEKMWGQFKEVQNPEQLSTGGLVGWKALGLNPQTFSPEILLSVARIVQVQDDPTGKQLTIRMLLRPVAGDAAFSFGIAPEDGQVEAEEEEVTYEWTQVLEEKWRLIDT